MLTDAGAEFLLDLLGVHLDEVDRFWFFSDWSSALVPRSFEERLDDLCVSRSVHRRCPRPSLSEGARPVFPSEV